MYIDIVIVNWNSGDYLRKSIQSIVTKQNSAYINGIIIIDNNSSDNSLSNLTQSDKLVVIKNNKNLGFSKACNQGFKMCTAKYTLLLNPDAQLVDNTLKECCLFLDANEDIDILGCQLLDDNKKITHSCVRFPTPKSFFYKSVGLTTLFPKIFISPDLMFDWGHTDSRYVDQVMGAFMFMRKQIFSSVGYFDERFFVYFEELDFSKRLAELKGKTYFNADIKAIHTGQGTTNNVKAFRLFLYLKSRLLYSKKHFTKPGHCLVFISTLFFEPVSRILFLLLKTKFKDAGQVLKSYQLLIKSFIFNKFPND